MSNKNEAGCIQQFSVALVLMAMNNETVDVETYNFTEPDVVHVHILSIKHSFSGQAGGMATCYELGGPGIESQLGGEIFRTSLDRTWNPPSVLYNG